MGIPAGWYDDGSGRLRWWDGVRWTEHVAPPSAAAGAPWAAAGTYAPPAASGYPLASPEVSPLGWTAFAMSVAGAVMAFIPPLTGLGVLVLVAGIVLSIVALVRPGAKWPGITGLIVSAVGLIVAGVVLVVSFVGATLTGISEGIADEWPDPVDSPSAIPVDGRLVAWWDVEVGDCLAVDQPFYGDNGRLLVVPCDTPHGEEVYYEYDLASQDFPGDEGAEAEAEDACAGAFADFVGIPYEDSLLDFFAYWPSEDSWASGDRRVQCMVYEPGTEVTGTLAGARR